MTPRTARTEAVVASLGDERVALVARLIRLTSDWDLAEDCVQEAFEKALTRWPVEGVPASPGAWITAVARNRAMDVLRRRRAERAKLAEVAMTEALADAVSGGPSRDDDRLRLIFTCCHPALPMDGRVALTLKTVAGLGTPEIARAFLVSEPALAQRLLRTKRKIAHAAIPYRVPPPDLLGERTRGVLATLYLIFNEGYGRREDRVAGEALRLAELLVQLMPDESEARGLLALMLFQLARRSTRFDENGDLAPIEDQDRTRWDREQIARAGRELRRANHSADGLGSYRLQAAIAACHATAPDNASTDWPTIVRHYDALVRVHPSPVIAMNRAIAVGFRDGFDAGLESLGALDGGALSTYYLLPAARADFLRRLGRVDEARSAYALAVDLAPSDVERRLLLRGLADLGPIR